MADVLLYLVTVLIWGSTWFAITLQFGVVPIEWSLVYRFVLSAVLLFAFCLVTGRNLKFPKALHLRFAGLGLFLFSLNYYLIYAGIEHVPSGLAAVLFSMLPLMNILNGMVFLKRKGNRQVAWLSALGIGGIALLFWPEVEGFSLHEGAFLGLLLIASGVWSASAGNTLVSTQAVKTLSVFQSNAWGIFYGTIFLTLFALFKGNAPAFDSSPAYLWSLAYLIVFGTIIAFTCYFLLIKRITVERASYITIAFPLVALAISTAFENFHWTVQAVIGMVVVLCGNYFVLKTRQTAKPAAGVPGTGAK
jgi:drug/metabolite transporter (DMT)-like permease